jgi:predicted protein tyrosine phosphatase
MLIPINRGILYKNKKLAIQILSQPLAEITDQQVPYFVISIVPFNFKEANLKKSSNQKAVLRLMFNDVTDGKTSMNDEQAEQVRDFVLENLKNGVHSCIIHCTAGISRSAGVGAAISKVINGDDSEFFLSFMPNAHCYKKVLEAFGEK